MAELRLVHKSDGEPCALSPLDHGDPICIHGHAVVEQWVSSEDQPEPPC